VEAIPPTFPLSDGSGEYRGRSANVDAAGGLSWNLATWLGCYRPRGGRSHPSRYAAWIDEQADGVLELLAAQNELPIVLATPLEERFGHATTENGMREFARKAMGTVAALANKAQWTPQYFEAARMAVMAMYFSAAELWGRGRVAFLTGVG
jgi:hypothetical protein